MLNFEEGIKNSETIHRSTTSIIHCSAISLRPYISIPLRRYTAVFLTFFFFTFLLSACSSMRTQKKQFVEVDKEVGSQNFRGAAFSLDKSKDKYYEKKDRVLFYLDLGMLYHYAKDYTRSNQTLTSAEDGIDELYTKSISKGAASLLLNDNALDYSGEDYENVYLNIFKALNYIGRNQYDEGFVEIRRTDNKLSQLEDKYQKIADDFNQSDDAKKKFKVDKIRFTNSALARYISLLMYRSEGKYDDARIDERKIGEAWSTESSVYGFPRPNLDEYLETTGKARLNVISFVGKSPEIFARVFTIHTFKDAIAIYQYDGKKEEKLEVIPWQDMKSGYHFKFSLPYMEKKGTEVGKIGIDLNGGEVASLQTIESLENVAQETYKLHEGITYLKTIIRTVVKGLVNERLNEELDKKTGGGGWGELTRAITGAVVDITENADLRLSRYFPAKAMVGEYLVDPGTYHLVLRYYSTDGRLMHSDDKGAVKVSSDSLNLYESFFLN